MEPARRTLRKIRASWRDTLLLLREFRWPLLWFALAMLASGWLYFALARGSAGAPGSLAEAVYLTITLTFLQANTPFPAAWYLQAFFFLMPVIGISILAQGLTDFGILLFNRRKRGKEWEMAVASTFSNHVVLVGLGHLGYRVVKTLRDLEQEVVAIELKPDPDLLRSVREMDVPVIEDDGAREVTLLAAGVQRARAIILCTQNDSLNLRMALKARSLNPALEVVIRIFDDEFAASLEKQFGFHAMSATGMAAPLFAAIAAEIDITPPITIAGQPHILANLRIHPRSRLCGQAIQAVEERFRVSVVMLCQDDRRQFHPPAEEEIKAGQLIAVFGEPERVNQVLHENNR
jgi:Trk K+ transport system NAD-binding subunit